MIFENNSPYLIIQASAPIRILRVILFPKHPSKMYWMSNTNTFVSYWIPNTYTILFPWWYWSASIYIRYCKKYTHKLKPFLEINLYSILRSNLLVQYVDDVERVTWSANYVVFSYVLKLIPFKQMFSFTPLEKWLLWNHIWQAPFAFLKE